MKFSVIAILWWLDNTSRDKVLAIEWSTTHEGFYSMYYLGQKMLYKTHGRMPKRLLVRSVVLAAALFTAPRRTVISPPSSVAHTRNP